MPASPSTTWTTHELLRWISKAFTEAGLDSPRLSAELLVAHALGCDRLKLYMESDRPATPTERDTLRKLTARALDNEPVQYLVGEGWFFSLPYAVDRRTLIPRPSSETLVDVVLSHARATPGFARGVFADLCAGSGCVGVALLKNMPEAHVLACDISSDALDVARINAKRHGVLDRMDLLCGDLLEPLKSHPAGSSLQCLVANPPYIPDAEWEDVEPRVRLYEPELALRGGSDGLRFIRPIIEQAPHRLLPGAMLLIEIAASTADAVLTLAQSSELLEDARIERDGDGLPRVLVASRTS